MTFISPIWDRQSEILAVRREEYGWMSYKKEVKLIQGDAGAQIKFHLFRSIYLQLDISFHPCSIILKVFLFI